jgi:hypothetical protein
MVEGLDKFRESLGSYSDNYIIIGGTACNVILEDAGTTPRVTHDIDMIVVVEQLTNDFVSAFWSFIREGGYTIEKRQRKDGEPAYALYRFRRPSETGYPSQIELLARHSESLGEPREVRIEPIPMEDYQYSLSAIVLDDDLYRFVVGNSKMMNGIRVASLESLICLKARAYLNLLKEREAGKQVNSDDIKKHRRDIILLAAARTETEPVIVPVSILDTIDEFKQLVNTEESASSLMNSLRIDREQLNVYLEALGELFIGEEQ